MAFFRTLIVLSMLSFASCGNRPTTHLETSIVPAVVKPSEAERKVLREQIPDFYVRFTEQQRQIMVINGPIQKRTVPANSPL